MINPTKKKNKRLLSLLLSLLYRITITNVYDFILYNLLHPHSVNGLVYIHIFNFIKELLHFFPQDRVSRILSVELLKVCSSNSYLHEVGFQDMNLNQKINKKKQLERVP